MNCKMFVAIFTFFLAAFGSVQAEGVRETLKFKPGHSSTAKEGCVVGADQDEYFLSAKPGQTMSASIQSEENNAIFNIYYRSEGVMEPVDGAVDDEGIKYWQGELPGDEGMLTRYKIEVGKERGNACYTLTVRID